MVTWCFTFHYDTRRGKLSRSFFGPLPVRFEFTSGPYLLLIQVPFPKERDITRCELRFKPAIPVARHIREFIRWLLNPDERNRPNFNDIQQHAWIKEGRERTERNSTGL